MQTLGHLKLRTAIFFTEEPPKLSTNFTRAGQNEATVEKIWMLSLKLYFLPLFPVVLAFPLSELGSEFHVKLKFCNWRSISGTEEEVIRTVAKLIYQQSEKGDHVSASWKLKYIFSEH